MTVIRKSYLLVFKVEEKIDKIYADNSGEAGGRLRRYKKAPSSFGDGLAGCHLNFSDQRVKTLPHPVTKSTL